MILEELEKRRLPELLSDRKQMLDALLKTEYGYPPEKAHVSAKELKRDENYNGGNAVYLETELTCHLPCGDFSFPVKAVLPKTKKSAASVVYISFSSEVPDKYLPAEEIADQGVAVFSFNYNDVTPDSEEAFTKGLGGLLYHGKREKGDGGAIALWAWAASRVLDWALTFECVNKFRTSVAGHSRLGKTALLAGALDDRFRVVYSNDSGCGGAALYRGKIGESLQRITSVFPYWFEKDFGEWAGKEDELPFDQHWLIACAFPRKVYVASASEDSWADPVSEYLSLCAVSSYYTRLCLKGFYYPDRLPTSGDTISVDGDFGYHLRKGTHFLTRYDWKHYLEFLTWPS